MIGCGQFWLLPRTAEETNDLDTQRNQAGGAFRVCDGTKSLGYLSRYRGSDTQRYKNLLKNPAAEVQAGSQKVKVRARTATAEEKPRLWGLMTEHYKGFDHYQEKTDREIPVVVLEPIS